MNRFPTRLSFPSYLPYFPSPPVRLVGREEGGGVNSVIDGREGTGEGENSLNTTILRIIVIECGLLYWHDRTLP